MRKIWGDILSLEFDGEEILAARQKGRYSTKTVKRALEIRLSKIIDEHRKPSVLAAIYKGLTFKPGVLGISLDLKVVLEELHPDLPMRLDKIRIRKDDFTKMRVFVNPNRTRNAFTMEQLKGYISEETINIFVEANFLMIVSKEDGNLITIRHDLIADVISEGLP